MIIQPIISILISIILTNSYSPDTYLSTFGMLIANLFVAIIIKGLFYQCIALTLGLDMLTSCDEIFLYDYPINPTNIPVFLVIDKS